MDSNYTDLKYMILDVDGTMTDGGLYYDNEGNELKKFNTRDAAVARLVAPLTAEIPVEELQAILLIIPIQTQIQVQRFHMMMLLSAQVL